MVIGSIISESQTAFVKDRQILYGILIANEVVDKARRSEKELILFKINFEKTYDSADWGYLDAVMGRMSFPALVLVVHYVAVRGSVKEGGRGGSVWWREIARIFDGIRGVGDGWFRECVPKIVGDGLDTYFWIGPLLGGAPLCLRFGSLFKLVEKKSRMVAEMSSLGWGVGGEV
ncbi:hypothetical protein TSUD_414460 [Trifolium subterraneum]|uniref:Reverse transcriptase domain-containing protein n=1 Tax=Trifolium subterraneum TaxID=3900 RepID=A0A2Z6P5B3_TRISU|nr:hypothetical protein TSUD_414460 [Trifolium subterraneum]